MAGLIKLGLLSLLSTAVLAVPLDPSGAAPVYHIHGSGRMYPTDNSTDAYYPTGTGRHRHRKHRITTTSTRLSTAIVTEYLTLSPSPVETPAAAETAPVYAAAAAEQPASSPCSTPTVYETQVHRVTITVEDAPEKQEQTPAPAISSAPPAESSAPAPAVSSAPPVDTPAPAAYNSGSSGSSGNDAKASEENPYEGATITYKPKGKEVAAAAANDVAGIVAPVTNNLPAPVAAVVASSVGNNKRGVAYNDLQYTGCFAGKGKVSWAYNWGQVAGSGLSSSFEYVPMLWGTRSDFTSNWVSNARSAISSGSTHILGFNEPDLAAQSNMDPASAAAAYKTYIHDNFAGSGVRLGSPAVTNGGGDMGLTWLNNFLSMCAGCQIDFVAIHWYDSATNIEYFKNHITEAHSMTGKPVWITEFGAEGSDDQVNAFMQTVLPWLDSQPFVERYSYFMARDGLLNSGTELSYHGNTYATY